ncbi:MAG TPA: 1-deoxy-D-xylulose-5-phosphate reductoisomerase, partial [Chitinophagaceae bacterium]
MDKNQHHKKRLCILGSTGSIGRQALQVIDGHPDKFEVEVLTAQSNADLLIEQAKKYKPNAVVIRDERKYNMVKEALAAEPVKVFAGEKALVEVAAWDSVDLVLAAIVGFAGLAPVLAAIEQGTPVALANKET